MWHCLKRKNALKEKNVLTNKKSTDRLKITEVDVFEIKAAVLYKLLAGSKSQYWSAGQFLSAERTRSIICPDGQYYFIWIWRGSTTITEDSRHYSRG